MTSHWLYKGNILSEAPEEAFGFIYMITNLITGKKYVGRKYLSQTRRKPLTKKQKTAGRKRRTVVRSESNWKSYTGSNAELNKDIEKLGKENFKFEILIFAETKGQVNYLEENIHHKLDVVLDPSFYNDAVGPRRFNNMVKDDIFRKKIQENLNF